jgi:CspA family cold shock protein
MATGVVKWFNGQKGFSAVERAGPRDLREGQKVSYEITKDQRTGKASADQLKEI